LNLSRRRNLQRAACACLALALAAIGLTACGSKKESTTPTKHDQLTLMLDFFPNADHAGIYAAKANGHFKNVGLDVKIRQPADPSAPIKQVAAGKVDLAISYEPEVLLAREKGLHVVSVGALVREPLTSIMSLPSAKIAKPSDLKGKTVGTAGIPYQSAYLDTIADEANIDPSSIKRKDVGFNLVSTLLAKRVAATLGGYWNYEGIQLQQDRRDPHIIKVQDAGVPTYNELVFVANQDALERDSGKLRAFLGALDQGTQDLKSNPKSAIKGLLDDNPDLDAKLQRASVKATLPLFLPAAGKPFAYQDPKQWDAFVTWMRDHKLVTKLTGADGAFTNEFLPGSVR
jgi:putative hydroxymethylpyrimidine transport system substrate-binding protein